MAFKAVVATSETDAVLAWVAAVDSAVEAVSVAFRLTSAAVADRVPVEFKVTAETAARTNPDTSDVVAARLAPVPPETTVPLACSVEVADSAAAKALVTTAAA